MKSDLPCPVAATMKLKSTRASTLIMALDVSSSTAQKASLPWRSPANVFFLHVIISKTFISCRMSPSTNRIMLKIGTNEIVIINDAKVNNADMPCKEKIKKLYERL